MSTSDWPVVKQHGASQPRILITQCTVGIALTPSAAL